MYKHLLLSLSTVILSLSSNVVAQNPVPSGCFQPSTLSSQTKYAVEQFIVKRLRSSRVIAPREIERIIGFEGCLQPQGSGRSPNIYVYRWEAIDGKAIEVRWYNQFFQRWKGENF
ncbi:MAG: hypothetical protein AB4041_01400 [Microcystaceae cyanobacterium]